MMQNTQTKRRFTPEEYETVSERVEIKVEYLDGQIVPKEGLEPLPEWVVCELLKPDFNLSTLNFEFPMATKKHAKVIRNLIKALSQVIDWERFSVFGQDPEIFITLSGKCRIPDVSVTPEDEACEWEGEKLTNPIVVIEILSPSNKGDEFARKIADYKSLESLQEYWLISQDAQHLNRFVRDQEDREEWRNKSYGAQHEEVEFPSLGVTLKTAEICRGIDFEKESNEE
jgi:Uma2 family endonuclease